MDQAWETAIRWGDAQWIRERLITGADANARDRYGQTGLMLAAHAGHSEVVEALVEAGADLNATAKYGLTALMLAVVATPQVTLTVNPQNPFLVTVTGARLGTATVTATVQGRPHSTTVEVR